MRAVGLFLLAFGCGGSMVDRGMRELCYAEAERRAQASVDVQCGDRPFLECPSADAIMAQLEADQKACP